jgi:hypothetical protein
MKKQTIVVLVLCSTCAIITLALAAEAVKQTVNYPEGFRQWRHVQSLVILKGNKDFKTAGGFHNVYANEQAFDALVAGKPYPDGSVLVNDVLTATENNHALTEGKRRFVAVMQKESKGAADTGGWAFQVFADDTKQPKGVTDPKVCFQCHASAKDTGYVFSKYRK